MLLMTFADAQVLEFTHFACPSEDTNNLAPCFHPPKLPSMAQSPCNRMHLFAEKLTPKLPTQLGLFGPDVGRAESIAKLKREVNGRHGRFILRSAATLPTHLLSFHRRLNRQLPWSCEHDHSKRDTRAVRPSAFLPARPFLIPFVLPLRSHFRRERAPL